MKREMIVDDHTMVREGLAHLVDSIPGYECCGMADSAPHAMALLEKGRPDLLLVDMTLPGRNGCRRILHRRPGFPSIRPSLAGLRRWLRAEMTLLTGTALPTLSRPGA